MSAFLKKKKDFILRKKFKNYEKRVVLRYFLKNSFLLGFVKRNYTSWRYSFNYRVLKSPLCQIKNRCVLTSRSRGIVSFYRVSRHKLRDFARYSIIYGIKKK